MASFCFGAVAALCICVVYVQSVSAELSPLSTYVTPVEIDIQKSQGVRRIAVRYRASSEPVVKWTLNLDDAHDSSPDVTVMNDFSEVSNNGIAVIRMPVGHFYPDPPSVKIHMFVENFEIFLTMTRNDILDSSNFTYRVNPVYYDIGSAAVLQYVKGQPLSIDLSLRSADLGRYDVFRSTGLIESIDYGIVPYETIQWWSRTPSEVAARVNRRLKPFVCAESFEVINATSRIRNCIMNTTVDHVSGMATFDLILKARESNSVIENINIYRQFYIQEEGESAPYRENTLYLKGNQFLSWDNADQRVSNSYPDFNFAAIGYPKPELYLKRGCGTDIEPIIASEVNTSSMLYKTTMKFTFPINTGAKKWETYVLVAKSGNFEISNFLSVERSAY